MSNPKEGPAKVIINGDTYVVGSGVTRRIGQERPAQGTMLPKPSRKSQ